MKPQTRPEPASCQTATHSTTAKMHHIEGKDVAKDTATISMGKGIEVQHQAIISESAIIIVVKASSHDSKHLTVITVYKMKNFYLPATMKHPLLSDGPPELHPMAVNTKAAQGCLTQQHPGRSGATRGEGPASITIQNRCIFTWIYNCNFPTHKYPNSLQKLSSGFNFTRCPVF